MQIYGVGMRTGSTDPLPLSTGSPTSQMMIPPHDPMNGSRDSRVRSVGAMALPMKRAKPGEKSSRLQAAYQVRPRGSRRASAIRVWNCRPDDDDAYPTGQNTVRTSSGRAGGMRGGPAPFRSRRWGSPPQPATGATALQSLRPD